MVSPVVATSGSGDNKTADTIGGFLSAAEQLRNDLHQLRAQRLFLRADIQQGGFAHRSPTDVAGETPVGSDRPANQIFLSSE
jgi:hypothetical protein